MLNFSNYESESGSTEFEDIFWLLFLATNLGQYWLEYILNSDKNKCV